MTGNEMYDIISNNTYNRAVYEFVSVLKDETCSETVAVGCQLILVDTDILQGCMNADELAVKVIGIAKMTDSFGGMDYHECEFYPKDDPAYEEADCGLQWCNFDVLWNALIAACTKLPHE